MTSAFDSNVASISPNFEAIWGDTVSIRRTSTTTSGVTAQKFIRTRTIEDEDGGTGRVTYTSVTECDWIIAKTAYVFNLAESRPRKGDRIIEADGTQWEVLPSGENDESSELPGGVEWLVKTKEV